MKKAVYLLMFILLASFVSAETSTVKGIVLDSLDNLVSYADLKLDCLEGNFTADKFGSFSIKDVPAGSCRIFANYNDAIGVEKINIEPNQTLDLEIKLDKTIVNLPKKTDYGLIAILVLILLVIIFFIWYFKLFKKIKKLEKEEKKEKKEIKELKGERVKDITKTLNSKEKKIIGFLLENNNQSSQAKVRHNTGIPRTTLARSLKNLEAKNIVSTQKIGKMVKIKLTDWFLGKE